MALRVPLNIGKKKSWMNRMICRKEFNYESANLLGLENLVNRNEAIFLIAFSVNGTYNAYILLHLFEAFWYLWLRLVRGRYFIVGTIEHSHFNILPNHSFHSNLLLNFQILFGQFRCKFRRPGSSPWVSISKIC